MIMAWRDRLGWLNFVFLGADRERERWEEMGELIMRNWDLREFRVRVNLPFLIWQVLLPIRRVKTPILGLLNPIRQVVPLTSHIHSYPPYRSHLHPPSLVLYHHRRTQSEVIPLYQSMPWSSVNIEYSIHRVQRTPSTAYTKYSIHQVQHTPSTASTQDCLPSLHSHNYELTPECSFSFRRASLQDRPPPAKLSIKAQR